MMVFQLLTFVGMFAGVLCGPLAPFRMRVEYLENPIAIDVEKPRFSWALDHTERGQKQTACRVLVYHSNTTQPREPGEVLWDSGKVTTNRSTNVEFAGASLTSVTRYFWTVTYWDSSGQQSPTSEMAYFQTGLMDGEEDWVFADWLDGEKGNQLRTEFELHRPIAAAYLHIVGLGYYQARINGKQVGDHVLGPFTTFEYRLLYDAHDVTDLIQVGQNALSVTLGHGWYSQPSVNVGGRALRCIMFLLFEGGGGFPVKTSKESWKQTAGPIVVDDIYTGETYNASMATPGWDMPGYDDHRWANATALEKTPTGNLSAHMMPHAKKVDTYSALNITEPAPGVFVFDFGQNMAGFCTLHLDQPGPPGTNVTLLHAEMMFENGFVQHRYHNSPELTVYVFSGDEDTIEFEPRFTYYGFRYVQMTGFPGAPDHNSLVAHFVHTAVDEESSIVFSEDYNILNGVQQITRFASLSNFISVPTDCPQRERRGWLGDAQLSAEFTIHNFDMAATYTKFLRDIRDTQLFVAKENKGDGAVPDCVPWYHHGGLPADPAWGVAYTLITYWMYHYYDDRMIIEQHYDGVKAHLDNLRSRTDTKSGLLTVSRYGDWCSVAKGGTGCGYASPLISSFYFIQQLELVTQFAEMLNKTADSEMYMKEASAARESFNKMFYNPSTKAYSDDSISGQTTHSLPLFLGLAPETDVDGVVDNLVKYTNSIDDHINTGIVGAKFLLPVLTDHGHFDLALKVASQKTEPSWGWMVVQGATTLWESWVGTQFHGVSSRNHIMFGGQGPWYYQGIAGINMVEGTNGYQHIRIQPRLTANTSLMSVDATLGSIRGEIRSSWAQMGRMVCSVSAENSNAMLQCPPGGMIDHVVFASFGTPNGSCGDFQMFNCSSKTSVAIVEKDCLGKSQCTIPVTNDHFGGDPCLDVLKHLNVQVSCKGGSMYSHSVTIPVNSGAEIHVPTFGHDPSEVTITEMGNTVWKGGHFTPQMGVTTGKVGEGDVVFQAGSGMYKFELSV